MIKCHENIISSYSWKKVSSVLHTTYIHGPFVIIVLAVIKFVSNQGLSLVVFFTLLTDRASTIIPSNIRGCQSGTWSAGQKNTPGKI